jgi:hypothetical protein
VTGTDGWGLWVGNILLGYDDALATCNGKLTGISKLVAPY